MNNAANAIKILCLHAKEDIEIIQKLEKHLMASNQNVDFRTLTDEDIDSKEDETKVHHKMKSVDIFLIGISVDLLISKFKISLEIEKAMKRHEKRKSIVIPIILSACNWNNTVFAKLQALPRNATPVMDNSWNSVDSVLLDVVRGIEQVIHVVSRKV